MLRLQTRASLRHKLEVTVKSSATVPRALRAAAAAAPLGARAARCAVAAAAAAGAPGADSTRRWEQEASDTFAGGDTGSGAGSSMSSSDLEGADAGGAGAGKLKLLCLHGFMQTADSFRMRVGSLRKALKSRVEFVFLDAPFVASDHLSEAQIAEIGGSPSGRTWLKWRDMAPGKRPSQSTEYEDFEGTFSYMAAAVKEHSPDGVLGFSQGATAGALLLAELAARRADGRCLDVPPPRFAVLISGFLPRDPKYAALLAEARVATPTLFVLGEADALVPPERTVALMETFDSATATLLRHPGAHMVPTCSGDVKRQMAEFLDAAKAARDAAGGDSSNTNGGGEGGGSGNGGAAAQEDAAAVVV